MAQRIVVITATNVVFRKMITYEFMVDSEAPCELFGELGGTYGCLRLQDDRGYDVEPADNQNGSGKTNYWYAFVGAHASQIFSAALKEAPPEEPGLRRILADMPDCVLLMCRNIFDRFEKICLDIGISVEAFHYEGILETSRES